MKNLFWFLCFAVLLAGCGHINVMVNVQSPVQITATALPTFFPTSTANSLLGVDGCHSQNLLDCGNPIPIFVTDQSEMTITRMTNGHLDLTFNNLQNGSGLALAFEPVLDVRGFSQVELSATCSRESTFLIEYKVPTQKEPVVAMTSAEQIFPATTEVVTVTVPITYDGTIKEMVINFSQPGDSAQLQLESIHLSQ